MADDDKQVGKEEEKEGEIEENQGEKQGEKEDSKKDDSEETYPVVVDGKTIHMTLEELKANASKAKGADAKFEKASNIRKEAEKGLRIQDLGKKINSGKFTQQDVDEFARLMGTDPTLVREKLETQVTNQTNQKKTSSTGDIIDMENLSPRVRAALEAAELADNARIREGIEQKVRVGVDKDPILSKIVLEGPAESQQQVRNTLFDMAMNDVRGRILAGRESFGPEMISSAVQNLRSQVKNLGILNRSSGNPAVVGLGPTGVGVAPEVLAKEPIRRKSISDPDYEETAIKRIQQDMNRRAMADQRSRR